MLNQWMKLATVARVLFLTQNGILILITTTVASLITLYLWVEFVKLCVWMGQFTWP